MANEDITKTEAYKVGLREMYRKALEENPSTENNPEGREEDCAAAAK